MVKRDYWIYLAACAAPAATGGMLALVADAGPQPDFSALQGQLLAFAVAYGILIGYVDTAVFEPGREVALKKGSMAVLARYLLETAAVCTLMGIGLYHAIRVLAS